MFSVWFIVFRSIHVRSIHNLFFFYILQSMKHLVVFDFDRTMINGNIDTIILDLKSSLRDRLINWRQDTPVWTDFMASIFKELHSSGVTREDIESTVRNAELFPSVLKICQFLSTQDNTDLIVLSDANDLFINLVLESNNISHMFKNVFSNPAKFDEQGSVSINHYHSHSCDRCPANLCKGTVLKTFTQERMYSRIIYFGDGRGDVCPCLSLSAHDIAFAREGYPLAKELRKCKAGGRMKASLHILDFTTDTLYQQFSSVFTDASYI